MTTLSLEQEKIAGRTIRLAGEDGVVEMEISKLDFPYVTGLALGGTAIVEFDLSTATAIEFLTPDAPRGQRVSVIPLDTIRRDPELLRSKHVRFKTRKGNLELREISGVTGSWVKGRLAEPDGEIRADLSRVTALEMQELNGPRTVLKSTGLVTGVVAGAVLVAALLKTSCPFVYVDYGQGWDLVGEAYAGAAFRSTQRDDLLPLPPSGDATTVRIRLRNEANETQYTDRAELVVVDHPNDVRALATFDGRHLLARPSKVPDRAFDGRGKDVKSLILQQDEKTMVTDPHEVAAASDRQLEDHLTAEFSVPAEGTPVLELVAANTAWLDLVFGRFFAAMGERLPVFLARGNDAPAGAPIQRWREREGVDLIVEVRAGERWQRVAVVPTVGPAAMREIAIPLPADPSRSGGPLTVRLRGGLGFWRIDRLALSSARETDPARVRRLHPDRAPSLADLDRLPAIAATDGDYDALVEMNDSLEMTFTLPVRGEGFTRSAFLSTNGYYNVNVPVQAGFRPGMLKTIRDEAGALSRFGRDLARQYVAAQAAASRQSKPVTTR